MTTCCTLPERLFQQMPQRARLAPAAVRLDQDAGNHQAIEVDAELSAAFGDR
jgi:hypothetical protein